MAGRRIGERGQRVMVRCPMPDKTPLRVVYPYIYNTLLHQYALFYIIFILFIYLKKIGQLGRSGNGPVLLNFFVPDKIEQSGNTRTIGQKDDTGTSRAPAQKLKTPSTNQNAAPYRR